MRYACLRRYSGLHEGRSPLRDSGKRLSADLGTPPKFCAKYKTKSVMSTKSQRPVKTETWGKIHWIGHIKIHDELDAEKYLLSIWSGGLCRYIIGQIEKFPQKQLKVYIMTKTRVTQDKLNEYLRGKFTWDMSACKSFQLNVAKATFEGTRLAGPWSFSMRETEKAFPEACALCKAEAPWEEIRQAVASGGESIMLGYVRVVRGMNAAEDHTLKDWLE